MSVKFRKDVPVMVAVASVMLISTPTFADQYSSMNTIGTFKIDTYNQYEQREPCQYYKDAPAGVHERCGDKTEKLPVAIHDGLLPVIATYVVYFDFDKSIVRQDQMAVLDKLSRELNTYQPSQITVVGHTDTAGDAAYNQKLSAKRAQSVSEMLNDRNIVAMMVDERAVGEHDLAVLTPDDVKLEANRRVVIQFRK
ncbi:MAG: OmpA family protein [Pseudobdellovibrionaceae bacterium]|jgi:outer membrane protein OmpA-like peptidoglycan-associated protein|nr:OmpA family protein [Pseudobdellovibrionaceae bacterium]